ncbi:hypothetical protein C1H71_09730 [Iodobacter fluviatilis]|uniref:Uncharacterized protein n=1 Tax=Iodobacter fluviatilis TaxID=537 RepID=A0A7G3G9G4_9NEIS|nr:hypothetical protein C1H71_09730 [Iodobacter fluviatilis]
MKGAEITTEITTEITGVNNWGQSKVKSAGFSTIKTGPRKLQSFLWFFAPANRLPHLFLGACSAQSGF